VPGHGIRPPRPAASPKAPAPGPPCNAPRSKPSPAAPTTATPTLAPARRCAPRCPNGDDRDLDGDRQRRRRCSSGSGATGAGSAVSTAAARGPGAATARPAAAAHPPARPRFATAKAQRWEPAEVLKALLTEEAAGRARSALATRRAAAAFPTGKTFEAWQPHVSSIPLPTQQALQTLEWIGRRENLVVCGPSGTGKTFLLEALGQQAVEKGLKVAWFTLEQLGGLVGRHRADDSVSKAIARVLRADLVVVDDIGLLAVAQDAAEGLYRLVGAAYEKRSVAISSNLHPAAFDELMPKTLATATVDRLLHHAHVCQTTGDSVRLTPSPRRERSPPTDLSTTGDGQPWADPTAITGQFSWPPLGKSHDRLRADPGGR